MAKFLNLEETPNVLAVVLDDRIIAQPTERLQTLAPALNGLWTVDQTPRFSQLLDSVEQADRELDRERETDEGLHYALCEQRERAKGRRTSDPRAAAAHAELADRYEALAVVFGAKHAIDIPADYH